MDRDGGRKQGAGHGWRVVQGGTPLGGRTGPSAFAELDTYWQRLRRGAAPPRRADIDPRAIAAILDRTMLIERTSEGAARVRVAGTALADILGMDLRGMPIAALIAPSGRAHFADRLEAVFAGPRKATVVLEAESGIGQPALQGQLLILPLTGDGGEVDRAICCLELQGAVGRVPRRFLPEAVCLSPVSPGDGGPPQGRPGHLRIVAGRTG
jgi:hypothetical protein